MLKIVHFVQNLSIDITIGALISSLFLCEFFGVSTSIEISVGLGIAIWLIYTADHLLDAMKAKDTATNPRHAFHFKYRKLLVVIAALLFAYGVYNATQLPVTTVYYGLILGSLSLAYFVYLKLSATQRFKELFAALVYTAGIFAGPFSLIEGWEWTYLMVFMQFFLLAYGNLLIFPLFERQMDEQQGITSIAVSLSESRLRRLIGLVLGVSAVYGICLTTFFEPFHRVGYIFILMTASLALLLSRPGWFQRYNLYRFVGDGIFWLPLIALL